jgi:hypothetical protein
MARKFTRIKQDTFKSMSINTGLLLKRFDVSGETEVAEEDIFCDTTGDVEASCVPTYSDLGEDVNNCPNGMMELMQLESWEAKLSFTALNITEDTLRLSLGAADVSGGKVSPRSTLDVSKDFTDVWLVFDRLDGGYGAVCLRNALSTGGLTLSLTKNGKGQLRVELTGHYSMAAQDDPPMEFYASDGDAA